MWTAGLITAIVGGLVYIFAPENKGEPVNNIAELGRLAFLAGLVAWLLGH